MGYLNQDDDDNRQLGIVKTALFMGITVIAIFAVVLYMNRQPKHTVVIPAASGSVETEQSGDTSGTKGSQESVTGVVTSQGSTTGGSGGRTSDELDIWDEDYADVTSPTPQPSTAAEHDITTDGNHTKITYSDGASEWVTINSRITKNAYNTANLVFQRPVMKYYENSTQVSFCGVDVCETQKYVDFNKLKKAGIDFAMIRLGFRGYDTGELKADKEFANNMKNAIDAGLQTGVYFYSQAVSLTEAEEEAEMVISCLEDYEITYPVAIVFGETAGTTGRNDSLTKTERTNIALTFMSKIEDSGYDSMVGANKEYLILKLDLMLLGGDNIWLMETGDIPDYPYQFSMWRYTTSEAIDGIAENANLNICFTDYSMR